LTRVKMRMQLNCQIGTCQNAYVAK